MVEKTQQHKNDFYYGYSMLLNSIHLLIKKIKQTNKKFKNIYAIPRGGLILGVHLSHTLNLPLLTDDIDEGTLTEDTLIVDDICDTGKTLIPYTGNTRVSLVAKPKGLNMIKDLIYDMKVNDDVWVHFPWEKRK